MFNKANLFLCSALLICLSFSLPHSALAWEAASHQMITQWAVANEPALDQTVTVEPIDAFLASRGMDVAAFIKEIEINPDTTFAFAAGEKPGQSMPVRKVLETYIVEPDDGMDQGLFSIYPDLWNDNYAFMGGNGKGLASQSFRHMYWPRGFLKTLGPIPVYDPTPLGVSPQRAQLFFDLSLEAARAHHPYWAARFLAWSMHYMQDASQPFHADQLPCWRMLVFKSDLVPDAQGTTNLVAYYHLAFEQLTSNVIVGDMNKTYGDAAQRGLEATVAGPSSMQSRNAAELTMAVAKYSASLAHQTGLNTMRFFPSISDPAKLDAETYLSSPEFAQELKNRTRPGPMFDQYLEIVTPCLSEAGAATRGLLSLMQQALGPGQGPVKGASSFQVSGKISSELQKTAADLMQR